MSPKTTQIVIVILIVGVVAYGLWTLKKSNDQSAANSTIAANKAPAATNTTTTPS